jgi:hypothetical protein
MSPRGSQTSKEPVSDSQPGFSKHLRTGKIACYETVGVFASGLVKTFGSFKGAEITGTGGLLWLGKKPKFHQN